MQVIQVGDRLQDNTEASLKRTLRMATEAEGIGTAVLGRLAEQEEKMNRMHEDMDDVQANLQRSKRVLGQLARGAASDRCVQLLCFFITLAVLACIVMAAMGYDEGKFNLPDEVRRGGQQTGR